MTGHDYIKKRREPAVQPTDVAGELAYERFELREELSVGAKKYSPHTVVLPTAWNNDSSTVNVILETDPKIAFDVPKWNLRPTPASSGLVPYAADTTSVDAQAVTVKGREVDLAESNASEIRYKKNHSGWQTDHDDIVTSLAKSSVSLNQFEIQQLMFNRFDATIVKLVDKANKDWGDVRDPLDPNIVKSILFRETQMGTSGAFMDDTSSWRPHHVMNHWNITQAIDSSGEMYARYFLEDDHARRDKFKLASILTDKVKVEKERDKLAALARRTPAQQARLDELVDLTHLDGKLNSENFFWRYPGMWDAINDLWKSQTPPLNNTYEHWIYMLLFELLQKRKGAKDWSDAVERYNGSGPDAENYREEVMKRVADALEQQRLGKPYVPRHDKGKRK